LDIIFSGQSLLLNQLILVDYVSIEKWHRAIMKTVALLNESEGDIKFTVYKLM